MKRKEMLENERTREATWEPILFLADKRVVSFNLQVVYSLYFISQITRDQQRTE
jgi:hypothetical protein